MQKSNNYKSVAPIPPPLNQRFRRGLLGGELNDIAGACSKFSINPGIQGILLNSTRRLKRKQAFPPRVIENLLHVLSIGCNY